MFKKKFLLLSVIASLLVACGGNTPTPAPTTAASDTPVVVAPSNTPAPTDTAAPSPTVAPTNTAAPAAPATATLPPPPTETATATPETPVPTNAPDCVNSAAFVADITIPDGSPMEVGSGFLKTWQVRNTGTCVWNADYTLVHYSEEDMGAPTAVSLTVTFPEQTLDITVPLTAATTLGPHRGNFVILNPAGLIMKIDNDSRLWVVINVIDSSAPAPTAPPTP